MFNSFKYSGGAGGAGTQTEAGAEEKNSIDSSADVARVKTEAVADAD